MKLAIFGASGLAREVRDIAIEAGYDEIIFITGEGREESRDGERIAGEQEVNSLTEAGWRFSIGIGKPACRREIRDRYPELPYVNLIHPAATFGYLQREEVEEKAGNIFFAGARMTCGIRTGNFGIFYLNCTVAHDCIIEDFVTICPGANISGNVRLSSDCFIGANACILQGDSLAEKRVIGRNSTVGAGAVVTKNVPDNIIVKGIPAK